MTSCGSRGGILVVNNLAACAALTKGAAKNKVVFILISTTWTVGARYVIALWVGRVPSKLSPAGWPSGGRKLPLETGTDRGLASLGELLRFANLRGSFSTQAGSFPTSTRPPHRPSRNMDRATILRASLLEARGDGCQLKQQAAPGSYDDNRRSLEVFGKLSESPFLRDLFRANRGHRYARGHFMDGVASQ